MTAPSIPRYRRLSALWSGPPTVIALLICYFALGLSAASRKSVTGDEGFHLIGGLSYWVFNDYSLASDTLPWAQRWIALPIWMSSYQFPPFQSTQWQHTSQGKLGMQFLYESGNDPDRMLLLARIMNGLLGVALGLLIYLWSRRLFGPFGGTISLALYAFSPVMLAHGFICTSDFPLTFFLLASVGALWRLLHRVSLGALAACCFTVAGLFMSKCAAVSLAPMALLLLVIRLLNPAPVIAALPRPREINRRLRKLAVLGGALAIVLLGVWFLIWASYGFRFTLFNPATCDQKEPTPFFQEPGALNAIGKFVEQKHLLPQAFLCSYAYMLRRMQGGNPAFLNGEFSTRGWLGFFPYCAAVKTPLELFLLLALAAAAAWYYRSQDLCQADCHLPTSWRLGRLKAYQVAPLLVILGVYWIVVLTSRLNIGHRHLLPTYPPLFILAGAAAWWFQPPRGKPSGVSQSHVGETSLPDAASLKWLQVLRGTIVAALLLSVVEALWYWPDYLAYFNLLIGGPRYGYRHLVDSSLDWSQDAKELKRWFDSHPADVLPPQRVYLSFFGGTPMEYFGIQAIRLPSFVLPWQPNVEESLHGGTYCISATELQNVLRPPYQGRWNIRDEEAYQLLRSNVELYRRSLADPSLQAQTKQYTSPEEWNDVFKRFEQLRFNRLCSFLRQREPDDEVGYSILIYRLTDDDIARALDGPPVELLEKSETLEIK